MASAGGKKKTKWKAVDPAIITNTTTTTRKTANWADETENEFGDSFGDYGRKAVPAVVLPTAPRAARGPEMEASIPKEPPYQAYLSNLSYEVTEEDLADFFADMKVKSVRLPKDDRGNVVRAKGFGYVEFEDRNSLIEALSMPDTTCKSRRMRIEVAEGDGRGGRGGMRDRGYGGFSSFNSDPERTSGDWRSGPRTEASDPPDRDGYRSGGMRRDYGSDRDRGGGSNYRSDDRDRGGFRRDGFGDRDGFRDRGGFEDRDRGGGSGTWRRDPEPRDSAPDRGDDRGSGGGTWRRDPEPRDHGPPSFDRGERRGFEDRGERRGFDDRGDRRGFDDRGERRGFEDLRGERRGFDDRDRDRGGGGGWRRDPEPRDSDPPPDRGEPKQRQRLNLQPRTKPVETSKPAEAPAAQAAPAANAAAIFGGARPVDTAAREREIEERLSKQRDAHAPPQPSTASASSERSRNESAAGESAPAASAPVLEPAPPPQENVWARRSQQTNSTEVR